MTFLLTEPLELVEGRGLLARGVRVISREGVGGRLLFDLSLQLFHLVVEVFEAFQSQRLSQ